MSAAATAPDLMSASVYRGAGRVVYEQVGVPEIGPGEILVQVAACGICHTDLKKIEYNLLAPPRIYGHETAGTVAAVGAGVTKYQVGDRVCVFHHIPCGDCFYCRHKDYAQCARYIQVGVTAGFEPAGGGFAQYVRVMDWIVDAGVEKIPDGVSFERGTFVEPLNTCLKGVEKCALSPDETILIMGQGPIGLLLAQTHEKGAAINKDFQIINFGWPEIDIFKCPLQELKPSLAQIATSARTRASTGRRKMNVGLDEIDTRATNASSKKSLTANLVP